jgi:hypothetical protein
MAKRIYHGVVWVLLILKNNAWKKTDLGDDLFEISTMLPCPSST